MQRAMRCATQRTCVTAHVSLGTDAISARPPGRSTRPKALAAAQTSSAVSSVARVPALKAASKESSAMPSSERTSPWQYVVAPLPCGPLCAMCRACRTEASEPSTPMARSLLP